MKCIPKESKWYESAKMKSEMLLQTRACIEVRYRVMRSFYNLCYKGYMWEVENPSKKITPVNFPSVNHEHSNTNHKQCSVKHEQSPKLQTT